MSEPFIGEIRIMGFTFPPKFWATCYGQTLPISQNTALYAIIGNMYGGDRRSEVGLPNLGGRVPMGTGTGPGLTPRTQGEITGLSEVVLTTDQIPSHTHTMECSTEVGTSTTPDNTMFLGRMRGKRAIKAYYEDDGNNHVPMSDAMLTDAGQNWLHENRQPFLALNFCIALQGIFPNRN